VRASHATACDPSSGEGGELDIGQPERTIVVTPLEEPEPREAPVEAPAEEPVEAPAAP
jgi:hypothetical protein